VLLGWLLHTEVIWRECQHALERSWRQHACCGEWALKWLPQSRHNMVWLGERWILQEESIQCRWRADTRLLWPQLLQQDVWLWLRQAMEDVSRWQLVVQSVEQWIHRARWICREHAWWRVDSSVIHDNIQLPSWSFILLERLQHLCRNICNRQSTASKQPVCRDCHAYHAVWSATLSRSSDWRQQWAGVQRCRHNWHEQQWFFNSELRHGMWTVCKVLMACMWLQSAYFRFLDVWWYIF